MKASFEQATGIIQELGEGNVKLQADLLRAKIAGRAKQEEETAAVLQRTGVIVKKLMDENAMLRIERNRLVEESVDATKQRIKDMKLMKEIIARRENSSPRLAAHKESRDQRARSLYAPSFFFCLCVFRA